MTVAGAFVVRTSGAAPERRQRQGAEVRPGSKSTAKAQEGFPGNMGDPLASLGPNTGMDGPVNNIQATPPWLPGGAERNKGNQPKVSRHNRQREGREKRHGSLSGFVVPQKAGERGRPEPGNREGACTVTEPL